MFRGCPTHGASARDLTALEEDLLADDEQENATPDDPDMDEEPDKSEVVGNVDQDGQGDGVDSESNGGPNRQTSQPLPQLFAQSNASHSHTSQLSSQGGSHSQLRDSPTTSPYLHRADQRQGASSAGRSNSGGFEQQAYIIDLLEQIVKNTSSTHGTGCCSGQKKSSMRRRSPLCRADEDKVLAKLIRDELALLLSASPPYGSTPSPSRLSAFASEWENSGHGVNTCETTAADFMVDIAGDPKSPWNVSAGRAFAVYLIEKAGRDDTPEMRKVIEKAFNSRVKSLKSHWKRDMLPQAAKVAEWSKHNRKQRKYQLFQRCREIVKLYDPLKKHLEVMDALGADRMSSDESSFDPHTIFDDLHHRNHINAFVLDKRGMFMHIRTGSQKVRQAQYAPPGLPVNAYDPNWLQSKTALSLKHELHPKEYPYDFNHSPEVIALLTSDIW
ncbi:hypothetical protein EDB85DRAFT_2151902 [Lactarius pseudohatsudake]|nr:hypothetical protein EDB85DRAFT_2151902 [Lactarius pseudohatsudake]